MKTEKPATAVNILDKTYRIHASEEEEEALIQSAAYLDEKMKEIQKKSQLISPDQMAIMAALNITHELLYKNQKINESEQYNHKLKKLTVLLENALVQTR